MEGLQHSEDARPELQAIIDRLQSEGYRIDHIGTGTVEVFSDEGYGVTLSPAEFPDDCDGDFLLPSQVTIIGSKALNVGSVFDYVAYTKTSEGACYEILPREPREWTPGQQSATAKARDEYTAMNVWGEPPTGSIF